MSEPRLVDVAAPDGRTLRATDVGPIGAPALLAHHGTPGAGRLYRSELESAEALGLRLITYDRPGYADSSPQPGRSIADAAADVAVILDALEIDRFATYGASGGGPHSLACAALLPERCAAAATIAGVAPSDSPELDWIDGMGEGNIAEMGAARQGRDHLIEFCRIEAADVAAIHPEELAELMGPHLSAVDAAALTGEFAEFLVEESIDAVRPGVEGWVDDDLAFLKAWGFAPEAITVPTLIWQGAQDLMVPAAHGHWLGRHVAGNTFRFSPDEGHLTLFLHRVGEVHAWLAERLTP